MSKDLPKPFLGRLLVEVIKDDVETHLRNKYKADGMLSADSKLVIPDSVVEAKGRVPISKGRIIEMAPDAFGKVFQERYGDDMDMPKLNDVVWFVPNQSYQVDIENKYHIIADCDIVAIQNEVV